MRLLAWLYLRAPRRLVRHLPDSVNRVEEGRWAEAVYESYCRWARRHNRRAWRKAAR